MKKIKQSANQPALIKYFELDTIVNVRNYVEFGIPVNCDIDFATNLTGSEIRYRTFENVKTMPNYQYLYEYYSQFWVHKEIYGAMVDIISEFDIPIFPGTLCLIVLLIKKQFEELSRWEKDAYSKDKSDYDEKLMQIVGFTRILESLSIDKSEHILIEISIKNKKYEQVFGRPLVNELINWFHNYYNTSRMMEHILQEMEYDKLLQKQIINRRYKSSFKSNYKYFITKKLNDWLIPFADGDTTYPLHFIRKLFTSQNIFGFNEEIKPGLLYDRLYQIINKPPKTIKK